MMEQDGLVQILKKIRDDLYYLIFSWEDDKFDEFYNEMPRFVHIEKCIIEKSDPFDAYLNPRKHDLAIYGWVGETEQKCAKFKILVEAKVDEPFGPTVEEAYQASLENPNSKLPNRIDELLDKYSDDEVQRKWLKQCRYQLLHWLAAATNGKDYNGSDTIIDLTYMLVLNFKTESYDSKNGINNLVYYYDFIRFFCKNSWQTFELINKKFRKPEDFQSIEGQLNKLSQNDGAESGCYEDVRYKDGSLKEQYYNVHGKYYHNRREYFDREEFLKTLKIRDLTCVYKELIIDKMDYGLWPGLQLKTLYWVIEM
jgi:hypothetical protein